MSDAKLYFAGHEIPVGNVTLTEEPHEVEPLDIAPGPFSATMSFKVACDERQRQRLLEMACGIYMTGDWMWPSICVRDDDRCCEFVVERRKGWVN